jgi:hypothetical protein
LQNIPGELYEAATVDGAGAWDKFWGITLPMLAPTTFYVVSTTTIQAMQVFEQVFILMNPPEGPNNSTTDLGAVSVPQRFPELQAGIRLRHCVGAVYCHFRSDADPIPAPAPFQRVRKLTGGRHENPILSSVRF